MTKAALRKIYKDKRAQLSSPDVAKFSDLVLINFQHIPLPFISFIHTYIAAENLFELDTSPITRYLKFKNPDLTILVPKIDVSGNMQHFQFSDEMELVKNSFGIAEPAKGKTFSPGEIDLVLVPLLTFDRKGYRVGYGKGYYDRFLSECREDVIKVGLSFFEPEEQIDDINQFDIPLNYCITPQQVYEF